MRYRTAIIIILVTLLGVVQLSVVVAASTYESQTLPFGSQGASQLVDSSGGLKLTSMYELDLQHADPVTIAIKLLNIILTFLGFAGMVLLVYAGVLWATARGNADQVEKAKHLIRRGALGLIIILMASAINVFIFYLIQQQFYGN